MDELLKKFTGEICACEHPVHGNQKCYEMDFNGTVWSNCRCQKTPEDFCMILTPSEFENVSRIQTDRRLARAA